MFPKPQKQKKKSKVREWAEVRDKELVPQFQEWGITTCEIIVPNYCKRGLFLGFAHTKKRRDIITPEDLRRVVLACQPCHDIVEYRCQEFFGMTMTEYLDLIIERRNELLQKKTLWIPTE